MLTKLKVGQFRCFDSHEICLEPGINLIVGPNARGKTSLLEAACVLLRLQSPRTSRLGEVIRHGQKGLLADGFFNGVHLQFYYGTQRKKLALDSVEQRDATEYLRLARVVWFANTDVQIIRDGGETRRRFLDFVAMQIDPLYRSALRDYDRAVRARNILLKAPVPPWKEIRAFDEPLIAAGQRLIESRATLVTALRPLAQLAHNTISGAREKLDIDYTPNPPGDFPGALAGARVEDTRLRQTTVGPHRDELVLQLGGRPAVFGSEGQQRTLVLALRLAAARLLEAHFGAPPLLLLDDIFGELDRERRAALLAQFPKGAQQIITTTQREWLPAELVAHAVELS
jgi:DNA replication and repair protein RecF